MINAFSYSVVIRTLGNTGEKYRTLLESIARQNIRPEEIIVVIPNGYNLDFSIGNERIVRSEKGMVTQRAVGIKEAKSEYILVVDDDLQFDEDFVLNMYNSLIDDKLDCVLSFQNSLAKENANPSSKSTINNLVRGKLMSFRRVFTGQHIVTYRKESKWFDEVTACAGHKTYESNPYGLCNCGCFQCFFSKTSVAQKVHLEKELWLEQGSISKYAAYDDMVFFYKMFLNDGRIAYSRKASYIHLDAGAGRPAKSKLEAKRIRLYSIARNRTFFWYKFLWSPAKKQERLHILCGGIYAIVNYSIYNLIVNCPPKYWKAISAMNKGYKEAISMCKKY